MPSRKRTHKRWCRSPPVAQREPVYRERHQNESRFSFGTNRKQRSRCHLGRPPSPLRTSSAQSSSTFTAPITLGKAVIAILSCSSITSSARRTPQSVSRLLSARMQSARCQRAVFYWLATYEPGFFHGQTPTAGTRCHSDGPPLTRISCSRLSHWQSLATRGNVCCLLAEQSLTAEKLDIHHSHAVLAARAREVVHCN